MCELNAFNFFLFGFVLGCGVRTSVAQICKLLSRLGGVRLNILKKPLDTLGVLDRRGCPAKQTVFGGVGARVLLLV